MTTVAELVLARRGDERLALLFEDSSWTYTQYVDECVRRSAYLTSTLDPGREPHVGLLLDNTPEFCFWLGGAALAGAAVVGINPTRRGDDLARDIEHTECQLLVTERRHRVLLDELDLDLPLIDVDNGTPVADDSPLPIANDSTRFLMLFTSGTTAAPKAVVCSQGRLARIADHIVDRFELTADDVCYCVMPMFHGNALMTSWAPALAAGATLALRPKFSASGFLPDVRRFGATYFNYVGRPLAYILATPEQSGDADNPLRRVFGNEAGAVDVAAFEKRFGCVIQEGYGSSEGGVAINRTPDTPPAALGPAPDGVVILDQETGQECATARFDASGRLTNADEAVGEIVSRTGAVGFEGYWRNDEAMTARVRDGAYWSGDLGYRDADGFIYFAGRNDDWIRVDGENIAAAPIEQILLRHPDVVGVAAYAVPDPQVGDLVMAALELRAGASFDPEEFAGFLKQQADLGTKMAPRFIRLMGALPVTATMKTVRRELRREAWICADTVWWTPARDGGYRRLIDTDVAALSTAFAAHGRERLLP
ncbi:MAG: steroid-22-oyl-CoA synthetase [Actinomycetota bacterium]|nr:steroid-22-oyl-CoA synthetase [Actinomycetota bacterium]